MNFKNLEHMQNKPDYIQTLYVNQENSNAMLLMKDKKPLNPRLDFNNLWSLITFRDVKIDDNNINVKNDFILTADIFFNENISKHFKELNVMYGSGNEFFKQIETYCNNIGYLFKPISFNNENNELIVDTSNVIGFAYLSQNDAREFVNTTQLSPDMKRKINNKLNNEIKTYNQYMNNNVNKIIIYNTDTNKIIVSVGSIFTKNKIKIANLVSDFINDDLNISIETFLEK